MSSYINFEAHSWFMGFAIKRNTNHEPCRYMLDGKDSDGTDWYKCVEHNCLAPSGLAIALIMMRANGAGIQPTATHIRL